MKKEKGWLILALMLIVAGIVVELLKGGDLGTLLVMLGGFCALWYRLGRIEGRLEEHLRKY